MSTQRSTQEILGEIPVSTFKNYLRPMVHRMIRDMLAEIREGVPAYAKPLEGKFGKVLVTGVEQAVRQVVESLDNPNADRARWEDWFRYAGKIEFYEGRSMDSLQSAVRIGTRVGWRHIRAVGQALNIPNDALFALADALFRYSDELCIVAIAGYTEAQAKASGTTERRRQQLLKLLVAEHASSPQMVAELAGAAHWTVPERVTAIALEYRADQNQRPATSLSQEVLVDLETDQPHLLMADPTHHLDRLAKELDGRVAAVGPSVPVADAHRSLAAARRALALVQRAILPRQDIVDCTEHLTTLALCADEFLLSQLTQQALQPLAHLTDKQRERLSETLLAWLGTRGSVADVAARLHVHPQTVRYRMNQVNNLLGPQLADPEERLKLEIALRAQQLEVGATPANRSLRKASTSLLPE